MYLGVAVSVLSVGYINRVLASLGPLRSCDRNTNSETENLALFKFYCTCCSLGLFSPQAAAWWWLGELQCTAAAHPPVLSSSLREGERVGRRKGLETDHQPSLTLGWGLPVSKAGPRAASLATPQTQGTRGNPSQPVLSHLCGQHVPIGQLPSCPVPRAISGGFLGALSCPILELRMLLGFFLFT